MLYMIIERFHAGKIQELYARFEEKGRMLPAGVEYINSWIDLDLATCYQVMESDSPDKLEEWAAHWQDIVDFEIIPVITSAEAKIKVDQLA